MENNVTCQPQSAPSPHWTRSTVRVSQQISNALAGFGPSERRAWLLSLRHAVDARITEFDRAAAEQAMKPAA